MRVVFDTCVLVPSFLREVLLACAAISQIDYIVSSQILTEWSRAAKKPLDQLEASLAVTQFRKTHALAIRSGAPSLSQFWLPDPNDIHVLGLAVVQDANFILTHNKKDFPKSVLLTYDIKVLDPDEFLRKLLKQNLYEIQSALNPIVGRVRASHTEMSMAEIWKKAWLPQFGHLIEKL
jgi:predicted nucleic acid-binding protein